MIKGDQPVKHHQVEILKTFRILLRKPDRRLTVAKVVKGKIPHKAAREGRQSRHTGALVLREQFTEIGVRIVFPRRLFTIEIELARTGGHAEPGAKTQKAVAAPVLLVLHALKEKHMLRDQAQNTHNIDRREQIGEHFARHRNKPRILLAAGTSDIIQRKIKLHRLLFRNKKTPPAALTGELYCAGGKHPGSAAA